jgi:hypothetical protein
MILAKGKFDAMALRRFGCRTPMLAMTKYRAPWSRYSAA